MNYNDIIKEKKALEDSILKRIQQYEEKTGFHVSYISTATEYLHLIENRNRSTSLVKITLDI